MGARRPDNVVGGSGKRNRSQASTPGSGSKTTAHVWAAPPVTKSAGLKTSSPTRGTPSARTSSASTANPSPAGYQTPSHSVSDNMGVSNSFSSPAKLQNQLNAFLAEFVDDPAYFQAYQETKTGWEILFQICLRIHKGVIQKKIQLTPHFILLDKGQYWGEELLPLFAKWVALWLTDRKAGCEGVLARADRNAVEEAISKKLEKQAARQARENAAHASAEGRSLPSGAVSPLELSLQQITDKATTLEKFLLFPRLEEWVTPFRSLLTDYELKMLNHAVCWLHDLMPHVLSKVHRVGYGLLSETQLEHSGSTTAGAISSKSRRYLALPFVGKDTPSENSEFSHPDILIGFTTLSYGYYGLRYPDFVELMKTLKRDQLEQAGAPHHRRKAALMYVGWISKTKFATVRGARVRGFTADARWVEDVVKEKKSLRGSSSSASGSGGWATGGDHDDGPRRATGRATLTAGLTSPASTAQTPSGRNSPPKQGSSFVFGGPPQRTVQQRDENWPDLSFLGESDDDIQDTLEALWPLEMLDVGYGV